MALFSRGLRRATAGPADDDDAEAWNLTRFVPSAVDLARGHLESTFLKLNDPREPRALWVRWTVFAPTLRTSGGPPHQRGRTVAEAWAVAFDHSHPAPTEAPASYRAPPSPSIGPPIAPALPRHIAVKATTPIEEATLARGRPFRLEIAGASFDGRRARGAITHGASTLRFDVTLTPRDAAPFVHFPFRVMYRGAFPKTKLVSPIVDAVADGDVEITSADGRTRRWEVAGWPAMQGHNWGSRHADTYAWAHCNSWHEPEGRDVVLEGFSAKVALCRSFGRLTTPFATIVAVRHRGVRYEARTLREVLRSRGDIEGLRRWTFATDHAGASIEGSISLRDDDAVGLYYPNPDGDMTYCLNSKIARATLRFAPSGGAPLVLTSDAAALEIGTHDATHGIRMYV